MRDTVDWRATVASVLVHVALLLLLQEAVTPPPAARQEATLSHDRTMELRFIAVSITSRSVGAPAERAPSPEAHAPDARRSTALRHVQQDREAERSSSPTHPANVSADPGSVHAGGAQSAPPAPFVDAGSFTPPGITGTPGVMDHKPVMTYTPTRLEDAWVPRDESTLAGGLRRLRESTTAIKTVDLGHGVRVHCAIGVLKGGCVLGDAPSRAAAKDGDARLSLPPPAAPAIGESDCIRAYRKDERVLAGCSTDTPLKAMDEENAERQRRAGP